MRLLKLNKYADFTSRWEAKINQWSDLLENVEPELDIDFGDKFTDILAWLEDYAE